MLSTLDILYIVLSFCAIAITIMVVLLGAETLRTVRDLRQISSNVEQITHLAQRVALLVFPGVERVAKSADSLERNVAGAIKKVSDKLGKLTKD